MNNTCCVCVCVERLCFYLTLALNCRVTGVFATKVLLLRNKVPRISIRIRIYNLQSKRKLQAIGTYNSTFLAAKYWHLYSMPMH
jgi:hypothetical protein